MLSFWVNLKIIFLKINKYKSTLSMLKQKQDRTKSGTIVGVKIFYDILLFERKDINFRLHLNM